MIPYGKQSLDKNDIEAVTRVLEGDWLTQGPKIAEFEESFAKYCGSKYAVAVSNGTAALHLANLVLGTTTDSKVLTTPITFLATVNSVIYAGGEPIFSDISKEFFTLDPGLIQEKIDQNPDMKGIITVHMGGVISNMEAIKKIADKNELWIIEDSCHALGGNWQDSNGEMHRVGDCSYSDISTFSFHPVKQITTGEGGAITTNDKDIYEQLLTLRTHGTTKDPEILDQNHGQWYYEMHNLGYNYRITDFQAALGIEQLKKNNEWKILRRELVSIYDDEFKSINEITPQKHPDENLSYSYHLYIIQCEKRLQLYNYLKENEINTQVHYIPIHLQPYFKENYGYGLGDFPVAESYYDRALSLPLYPTLKKSQQRKIISLIRKFYEQI